MQAASCYSSAAIVGYEFLQHKLRTNEAVKFNAGTG